MSESTPSASHHSAESAAASVAGTETIVLGGGCFWCTEAVYLRVRGVLEVESGYCNGPGPRPTYEQVCTGRTGYAEVVRLKFDPSVVTLRELLEIFFVVHDPYSLNRQGNDVGTQYRSGIYFGDASQQAMADTVIAEIGAQAGPGAAPVVTEVAQLEHYFAAEAYHQNYFAQHPNQGYCAMVVSPKVEKFRKTFARLSNETA